MSRIDVQVRITRNFAIIRYQLEELARQGLYMSRFTEELTQQTLNAVLTQEVGNLNTFSNNFPGIDLRSADEMVGYQVTRHATKAKYDTTISSLVGEFDKTDSRVSTLRDVYVVGLTSVKNSIIHRWRPLAPGYPARIRMIELHTLLDLSSVGDETLLLVDDVVQDFVNDWGRPRRSDAKEIATIVGWLDRPAIRDTRALELSWVDMNAAMQGIRRLLGQGVDELGHPVTRPKSTFHEPFDQHLQKIYSASHKISQILAPHVQGQSPLSHGDVCRIDRLRLEIQKSTTELSIAAEVLPPQW